MIDSFSEAEKLLLVFDMFPKFTDLIGFTILSSHLGGQYNRLLQINPETYLQRLDTLKSIADFYYNEGFPISTWQKQLNVVFEAGNKLGRYQALKTEIVSRQQYLAGILNKVNLPHKKTPTAFKKLQLEMFTYEQRLVQWKNLLNQPQSIEKQAVAALTKTRAFNDFMVKHSLLANLFGIAGGGNVNQQPETMIKGLQSHTELTNWIQQRNGDNNFDPVVQIKQAVQSAYNTTAAAPLSQISQDMLPQLSLLNSNIQKCLTGVKTLPPYDIEKAGLKTRNLFERIELGWNIQAQRSDVSGVVNDVGISLGYKINPKSVAGVGMAYKFGLGTWEKIKWTHEGIGLRSFLDYRVSNEDKKILRNIWLTSGYELNYWSRIDEISQWKKLAFQPAGIIGVYKKMQINNQEIKIQMLYDFLHIRSIGGTPLQIRYFSSL